MEDVISGLLFLREKLYNGIFKDKLYCIDKAILVCKKATPAKVKWEKGIYYCPECGNVLNNKDGEQYFHCPKCAKALDWYLDEEV